MLVNTFCHIPRVSPRKEQTLWDQGIHTWSDYRGVAKHPALLDESAEHLALRDAGYFWSRLQSHQHWRLFGDFRCSAAYVDIETTGLNKTYDEITTIALYDGSAVRTYVNGRNLKDFVKDVMAYKLLVTFNGKTFDVPFIQHYFGVAMPHAHIDLRYVMKSLGYAGGLKEIERRVGIDRGGLRDVDGYFAVMLWHEYKRRKNEAALETLLAYNCADVVNLEALMVMAYNQKLKETPFAGARTLQDPAPVKVPFRSDQALVGRFSRY